MLDREVSDREHLQAFGELSLIHAETKLLPTLHANQYFLTSKAYIIGHYYIGNDGPYIGGCPDKAKTSLISVQSEEEILKQLRLKSYLYFLGFHYWHPEQDS